MTKIEKSIAHIYPHYGKLWDALVDNANLPAVMPDTKWKLWGRVCLRDIADLIQTARKHFRLATIAYRKEYRHHEEKDRIFAKLYYFRESFDYATICTISGIYSYTAALCHFFFQLNDPQDFYPTPTGFGKWLSKRKELKKLAKPVISELRQFTKNKSFILLNDYRNAWVHGGYPLIKGEVRRTRRDVYANRKLIRSTFGAFGNGWPLVAEETHQHTVSQLMLASSRCYRLFVRRLIIFFQANLPPEEFAKYSLSPHWPSHN